MSVTATFLTTSSAKLSSIPVVDGQVIALADKNAWFYDMGSTRHAVGGNEYYDGSLPDVGMEDVLYILTQAGADSGFYIWADDKFVKVSSSGDPFVGATSGENGSPGLVPGPAIADRNKFLRGDGTWSNPANTEYSEMTGASEDDDGQAGLVPTPYMGDQDRFLCGDGTWKDVIHADTKNTVGATSSTKKLFLAGAETQTPDAQSYTNVNVFMRAGKLFSNAKEVVNLDDNQALTNKTYEGYTLGDVVSNNVASEIAEDNEDIPTSGQVYAAVQKALDDAKAFTTSAVADVIHFGVEVVDELPTSDIKENTIYLVPNESAKAQNVKTEYLYIEGQWEIIGSTQIDLSAYSTTAQMNTAISTAITTALNDYVKESDLAEAASKELPAVATSGSYNDLKDKPTIPTKFSDLVQDKVLLTDDVTGIIYQLGVSNGKICITEVS